ncbi:MAG: ABC transporter permease [Deltaproteobacteria bacterium]|nr:ABC transporter permease [Deltaproteobacteria bacterium]MBI3294607.1 ABC transporter permease [Deltaproteobacteria bacterium]
MKSLAFSLSFACTLALAVAAAIIWFSGESPLALWEALRASLSSEGLGYTLFYATPFVFTGLSVAVSFHCGLFNIGAEGQLYMGTLAVIATATALPHLPPGLAIPLGILAAGLGGASWGCLAGMLKAWRGSHEVIVTILLNFVAYSIVDYSILYLYRDPVSQSPETLKIPGTFSLNTFDELLSPFSVSLFRSTPANLSLVLGIIVALAVGFFLFRTRWGFELRTVGANARVARFAGMNSALSTILALSLSGGLAGLVGVNEVMGHEHRFIQGFSPGYGFTGVAVALLGRNHPVGVICSALLFGLLHNMSREIEFATTHVSKELSLVIQAIIVLAVATQPFLVSLLKRRSRGRAS